MRLHQAYVDAQQAVDEVVRDTGNLGQMRALDKKLAPVGATLERLQDQGMLPASARLALPAARGQPPVTLGLVGTPEPTPTTAGPVFTTLVGSPTTTQVPTTTLAPTTTQVPTTTQAPTTTTVPADVNDSADQGGNGDSGQGSSGETATTLPSP